MPLSAAESTARPNSSSLVSRRYSNRSLALLRVCRTKQTIDHLADNVTEQHKSTVAPTTQYELARFDHSVASSACDTTCFTRVRTEFERFRRNWNGSVRLVYCPLCLASHASTQHACPSAIRPAAAVAISCTSAHCSGAKRTYARRRRNPGHHRAHVLAGEARSVSGPFAYRARPMRRLLTRMRSRESPGSCGPSRAP